MATPPTLVQRARHWRAHHADLTPIAGAIVADLADNLDTLHRLAEHLTSEIIDGIRSCEAITGPHGHCGRPATAIGWELRFGDQLCDHHAHLAARRGALVIHPRRHTGD